MRSRLILFFGLLGLFQFASGQTSIEKRLDFSVENLSVPEALLTLSRSSGVDITFSRAFFKEEAKVSFSGKNQAFTVILQSLLKGTGIGYKVSGERVLLYRLPKERTYAGYIVDSRSGEAIVSATVYCPELKKGVVANEYGFFNLTLPEGNWQLVCRSVGYAEHVVSVFGNKDQRFRVGLTPGPGLPEVVISEDYQEYSLMTRDLGRGLSLKKGVTQNSPGLGGVEDPLRAAQLLPGINGGVEGTAGLHVRGADPGHNLMLMDGAPIFIPFHLLGAYSVYNSSAIKDARLVKGGFSSRYGGRLSSVFDVRVKEGDLNNWHGEGLVNFTQAQLSLEGPLQKQKGAVFASARVAPASPLLASFFDRLYVTGPNGKLETAFYDLHLKFNYILGKKDRLYLSFFQGGDNFEKESEESGDLDMEESETSIDWGNTAVALRWNHLYSNELFSNTILTYSRFQYKYSTFDRFSSRDTSALQSLFFVNNQSQNTHLGVQTDFDWFPSGKHQLRFGGGWALPSFSPVFNYFDQDSDELTQLDSISRVNLEALGESEANGVIEGHVYVEDQIKLSPRLKAIAGVRTSFFLDEDDLFISPEPRLGIYFQPRPSVTFRVHGNRMVQYLHLIPNTAIRFPNDIWITSSEDLHPQQAWMGEFGADIQPTQGLKLSLDLYYRSLQNLYALPDSLEFLRSGDLTNPETFLNRGEGITRGAEFLASYDRKGQKVQLAYTLASSDRQFASENQGLAYPHAFDRRHQFSLFYSQRLLNGLRASLNWVVMSANPRLGLASIDSGVGWVNAGIHPPGEKNQLRSLTYHRLDLNVSYSFTTWKRVFHRLKAGLYNAYNRKNVAYYDNSSGSFAPVFSIPLRPSFQYSIRF